LKKLLKTIKDTGGNLMDKFKFVGGNTGISLSDIGSAEGFFDNLQNALGDKFGDLRPLGLNELASYEIAGFKMNNDVIRVSIKYGGTTHPDGYTIEMKWGSQSSSTIKIRIF